MLYYTPKIVNDIIFSVKFFIVLSLEFLNNENCFPNDNSMI